MKKTTLTLAAGAALLGAGIAVQATTAQAGTITVYRNYNSINGEHLYTGSH